MLDKIGLLKGIHPGIVLERERQKRNILKGDLARKLGVAPQRLRGILTGQKSMTAELSVLAEKEFLIEAGFFMALQLYFDEKQQHLQSEGHTRPPMKKFRKAIFWDTDPEKIDWNGQKEAVITRVYSRGNAIEKKEILQFYGRETVTRVLSAAESRRV